MTKIIFFDFWGTLAENGVESPIKQIKEMLNIRLGFSEYVVRLEQAMMTQKFAELKEAFEEVCKEFQLRYDGALISELVGLWNKSWMLAQPYEEVEEVLKELSQKYRLVLVSNTDNFSVNNVLNKYNFGQYFEKMFFSYDLHLIKTDPLFFKKIISQLDVQVEDCVMVGDSIQSDIIAAKRIGMKAVLIDRKNRREFTPKISNLKELETVL